MDTIAKTLADLDKTLPRDGIHRNRMALEDEYASVWKHFTRLNGEDATSVALTKQACRTQGCSEYFLEVVERLIKAGRQYPDATHNEAKVRLYAALRWAIHLSPDFGEEVFRRLDTKLDTSINRSCPLDFVNAYQAFKVRDAEK
jgi:hypothetical protein